MIRWVIIGYVSSYLALASRILIADLVGWTVKRLHLSASNHRDRGCRRPHPASSFPHPIPSQKSRWEQWKCACWEMDLAGRVGSCSCGWLRVSICTTRLRNFVFWRKTRGIKLADAKYYIYIIYSASIIAMILVAGPLMWLVKKRHERRERSKFVNGGGTVSRYWGWCWCRDNDLIDFVSVIGNNGALTRTDLLLGCWS